MPGKKTLLISLFCLPLCTQAGVRQILTYADIQDGIPDVPGNMFQNADTEDGLDSPGDVYIFDERLLGSDGISVLGRNAGYCIRTDPGTPDFSSTDHPELPDDPDNNYGQCQWTLHFTAPDGPQGQIVVAGREADFGLSEIPIVGTTGDFFGMRGVLCSTPQREHKRFKQLLLLVRGHIRKMPSCTP